MRFERFEERGIQDSFITVHLGGQSVVLVNQQKIARHFVVRKIGYLEYGGDTFCWE